MHPIALAAGSAPTCLALGAAPPAAGSGWTPNPLVLVPLAASALLYATGRAAFALRGREGASPRWRALAFAVGLAVLAVALASPVDRLSGAWLSVHTGQGQLLALVAAPLLVLGRPVVPFVAALPPRWQARVVAAARRPGVAGAWAFLTAPVVAVALHGVARWGWHVPGMMDTALAHRGVLALQHLSLLATAVLLWSSLLDGRGGPAGSAAAVGAVVATAAQTAALGAILALAPAPLYWTYAARLGARALADQMLAGLILGLPAGALLAVLALVVLVTWLGVPAPRAPRPRA